MVGSALHLERSPAMASALAVGIAVLLAQQTAQAQSVIKSPGDHPKYGVELEPHVVFGWANYWASDGFGIGARASIPIVDNGFIGSINNSVAIGFGLDYVHYSACYYDYYGTNGYGCGAGFVLLPIVLQWNFFVARKISVFGEPGLVIYHGFFDTNCDPRYPRCSYPSTTSVDLALYAGARFHLSDSVALTLRIGYPTVSLGLSLFL